MKDAYPSLTVQVQYQPPRAIFSLDKHLSSPLQWKKVCQFVIDIAWMDMQLDLSLLSRPSQQIVYKMLMETLNQAKFKERFCQQNAPQVIGLCRTHPFYLDRKIAS